MAEADRPVGSSPALAPIFNQGPALVVRPPVTQCLQSPLDGDDGFIPSSSRRDPDNPTHLFLLPTYGLFVATLGEKEMIAPQSHRAH